MGSILYKTQSMHGKIIIVGPGGSGKDFLRKKMVDKGFSYGVSFTSRPPRVGEVEGSDYYFRSLDFFEANSDLFLELQEFNGWKYGISKEEFKKKDLFILSPAGLKSLPEDLRKISFVIYLNPDEKIRIKRLESRNDADSVERRLIADGKDFFQFSDYDIMITNEDF
jgi:guanylate kinase